MEKQTGSQPTESQKARRKPHSKPVLVYIMILFIAAFLLMALSFLMHQRTNTAVLGELQNSFTSIQELQEYQEKVISLQEELKNSHNTLATQEQESEAQLRVLNAMIDLYNLQQAYSNQDYDACQAVINRMESSGSALSLPTELPDTPDVTPPSARYEQFKEAVTAIQALGD